MGHAESSSPKTLVVYLDSSDYSALSDPRRDTPKSTLTRDALSGLAQNPRVCFAFSGAHLSELAPLDAGYAPAATARVELLVGVVRAKCSDFVRSVNGGGALPVSEF
jgi:hypothetical protein